MGGLGETYLNVTSRLINEKHKEGVISDEELNEHLRLMRKIHANAFLEDFLYVPNVIYFGDDFFDKLEKHDKKR